MQSEPHTRGAPDSSAQELLPEAVEDEQVFELPPREALSIVDPGIFGASPVLPIGRTADQPPSPGEALEPTDPG